MGSDKDQVGIGVITSDFAARDLGAWCGGQKRRPESTFILLSHGTSHLRLRKPFFFSLWEQKAPSILVTE